MLTILYRVLRWKENDAPQNKGMYVMLHDHPFLRSEGEVERGEQVLARSGKTVDV